MDRLFRSTSYNSPLSPVANSPRAPPEPAATADPAGQGSVFPAAEAPGRPLLTSRRSISVAALGKAHWSDERRLDSLFSGLVASHDFSRFRHPSGHDHLSKSDGQLSVDGGGRGGRRTSTPIQAAIALIKCAIGAGSFSLPGAFKNGGLVASFFTTIALGALSAYTVDLLARSERQMLHLLSLERERRGLATPTPRDEVDAETKGTAPALVALGAPMQDVASAKPALLALPAPELPHRLTYPELARLAFPAFTLYGVNAAEVITYCGIVATALGVCSVYLEFIAGAMVDVVPHTTQVDWTLFLFPLLLLLVLLRNLRHLAFTSLLGDVAVSAAIVAVSIHAAHSGLTLHIPAFESGTYAKMLGSTSFLFAIHVVILPIAQSLQDPGSQFRGVAYWSYTFITLINALFGAICLAAYGAKTESNVLSNLPQGGALLSTIRVLLAVDLTFTFPLVFAAGREIVEEWLVRDMRGAKDTWSRNAIRLLMLGAVVGIVFGIPNFGNLVSLVGGVCNSLMGFILPPTLYLRMRVLSRDRGAAHPRSRGGYGALADHEEGGSRFPPIMDPSPPSIISFLGHALIVAFGVGALVLSLVYSS
mmetsp:Transcript_28575/g.92697  ORF Transcript_28575/g.92697 Transcript_28575/m.92697 type:complete len:592 (-) Transcript_28575:31-1806(-)